ncbi:MAG: ATP synthase F1 subunit epsilon [Clostridia bacterium]|nr:ATP synthase F1 subunit epsilon [Clostridia bacterium]
MTTFSLKIVTPDGLQFDGQAEELIVRTTSGDIGIMAGHINCVAPLGMGRATIVTEGKKLYAACIGGILSVVGGEVKLVPTTFEWADQIDKERADRSEQKAKAILGDKDVSKMELEMAEAKLKRALVRKSVAETILNR